MGEQGLKFDRVYRGALIVLNRQSPNPKEGTERRSSVPNKVHRPAPSVEPITARGMQAINI